MTIVSPTLEQLAQYGSLDSLPFSLDNAQYVDFRDPNLDQLANWGGLDTLPFSLDSTSWENAFVRLSRLR